MRTFTRKPYYKGPDDPERTEVRGTLKLGETVIIETPGGRDSELRPGMVPEIADVRGSRGGGPFVIQDVDPGDWVAIEIIDVVPGPYGYYNNGGPFRGSLRSGAPVRDGLLHFPPDFVVPIRPMIGVVGLKAVSPHPTAWNHGGNMDFNSIRAGSTVHIRAQQEGGLLTIGDGHAYMSDGELTGTGVEIDLTVTLKVDRSPGFPTGGVVVENEDWIYTAGMGATWEDALKIAWTEMVGLIADLYDTTVEYANLIVGTIGDAIPGYSAGAMNSRGFLQGNPAGKAPNGYVTCQIAIPKSLRRTDKPFEQ